MPIFSMLFFLVVFCGILIYVIYRVLGKQASEAADRFADLSEEIERKNASVKQITDEAEARSRSMIAEAQKECERLRKDASDEVERIRVVGSQEARKEAERIVNDAIKAREGMKAELESELNTRAIESACRLFVKVFPEALRYEIHHYWLNHLLENGLEALDQFETKEKIQEVKVESAFALSDDERKKILIYVQKKVVAELELKEEVCSELVGGLRLKLGHLVLEASLVSNLMEVARNAKNDAA